MTAEERAGADGSLQQPKRCHREGERDSHLHHEERPPAERHAEAVEGQEHGEVEEVHAVADDAEPHHWSCREQRWHAPTLHGAEDDHRRHHRHRDQPAAMQRARRVGNPPPEQQGGDQRDRAEHVDGVPPHPDDQPADALATQREQATDRDLRNPGVRPKVDACLVLGDELLAQ